MGNSQGNQTDNRNLSEKQRKSSNTVRGRVLARFRSRNSLQTNNKDNIVEPSTAVINDGEQFTNIQHATSPTNKEDFGRVLHGTADCDVDVHSSFFEKVDKRISQISQGADSAKDALLDFANQKQFDSDEPTTNVPTNEQIFEIKTSAARAPPSTLPLLPSTTAAAAKSSSFHRLQNEVHVVSLTSSNTSETSNTVSLSSSSSPSPPADIHELNQTTTTTTTTTAQTKPSSSSSSSKELWKSSNVRTTNNNVFSNCSVPNDVAVANSSTATVDTIISVGTENLFGDDRKSNEQNQFESNANSNCYCENNKNIIFSTRSWNIARRINDLFKRRRSETASEIANKLTPSTTDVIVLREQTTSSSSDSIFTDPLTTPIGFSTEINQCYYSEENVCDTSDVDKLGQLAGETIPSSLPSQSYSGKTKSYLDILNKLSKLSLTNVDCYTTVPNYCSDNESSVLATSDEIDAAMSVTANMQKTNRISPSTTNAANETSNGTDKMNIFNIARVKKVELNDLPTLASKAAADDSVSTTTTNDAQLTPTAILQQQPISQDNTPSSTPSSILLVQQQTPSSVAVAASACSSTTSSSSHGDGNVLKKVASLTVERTNSDNTASKISRPSYVPEKLNFGAYEKFEGQMLLNWMSSSSSSSQLLYNVSDQDISQLIQQYCTNLLVAGVIKQIADKYAPIQETFRPNLMYEWTYASKSTDLDITPKLNNSKMRSKFASSTPGDVYNTIKFNESLPIEPIKQNSDTIDVNALRNRINVARSKFNECQMDAPSMNLIAEVFKDLEMISIGLLAVQKKLLSQKDLPDESDSDLFVSCMNETLLNASESSDVKPCRENTSDSSVKTIENLDSESTEDLDNRNASCDKIEICKYCRKTTSPTNVVESVPENQVNVRAEKETQTDSNLVNEIGEMVELKSKTVTSSEKTLSSNNPQSDKSIPPPPPPPMPTTITSSTIPPQPPMMPGMSFSSGTSLETRSGNLADVSKTPQSMPPPPPPIPPPFPAFNTQFSSIPPPPPPCPTTTSNGLFPPPPPPPPLIQQKIDTVDGVSSSPSNGLNGLVGPSSSKTFSPTPLPMPSAGNAWFQANTLRKNALKPPKPMKPLYWTRIVAPSVTATPQSDAPVNAEDAQLWKEIDETTLDNLDEFTEMFSRPIIEPKKTKEETQKPVKAKTIKVLDSKRSQSVGIFSRSLHVNFDEIEHAIYHCDTSVVSLEALQTLMEIKATAEELEMINAAAETQEAPLDTPEEFLLKISKFSCSAERISCIVFQSDFEEGSLSVTKKLNTVVSLCEVLLENDDLKTLFSIILTLGNYMNGGNRQRGQADGFGLEILGKLKDVKSKDPKVTLLHFIVKTYIDRCRKAGTPLSDIVLPIPDPGDVVKAVAIDFKEVEEQVNGLESKLNECRKITDIVISKSSETTLQPFKGQMESFLDRALKRIEKLSKKLTDAQDIFLKTLKFYKFMPKSGPLTDVTPGQFFEYWAPFTNDFRDIWKKEMTILNNEIMQKARALYNKNLVRAAERKVTPTKPGSLKERMLRLRKKQNEKLSKN